MSGICNVSLSEETQLEQCTNTRRPNTPSGFDHPRHDEEHDLINHNARVAEMIDAELGPDGRQFIIG